MKKVIVFSCLVLVCTFCTAQNKSFRGISFGLGGGYTNFQTITQEGFVQLNFNIAQRPFEPKIGVSHHVFESSLGEIDHLESESVGLFLEATIFPFHKYFFAGFRADVITFNWLTNGALNRLNIGSSSDVFSGMNFYGIAGLDIPLFSRVNLRIYGMPGIQQYKISDGTFSSGNYVFDGTTQEESVGFVYQVNLGLVIRLFEKK
jgi:hypothetical protein